jgi:hypothetical protein
MKPKPALLTLGAALFAMLACAPPANAADAKFEAQLVWGTNDKQSPDPKHKPVEPAVNRRLSQLPLKYTNYFEVNRRSFTVPSSGCQKVDLSDKCEVEVKKKGQDTLEVSLIGKGEKVVKRTQPLPKGEMLVVGGNAPNETAWLVIVKRVE